MAEVAVNTVSVGKQVRSDVNEAKIEALKQFLDIVTEEEVDQFFLANMKLAVTLNYRLTNDPEVLLTMFDKELT